MNNHFNYKKWLRFTLQWGLSFYGFNRFDYFQFVNPVVELLPLSVSLSLSITREVSKVEGYKLGGVGLWVVR